MITIILSADNDTLEVCPKDNIKIPLGAINDNLQHEEARCTFSIPYNATVFNFLIQHDTIGAVVMDDETSVFTGLINREISWVENGRPEPLDEISLVINDNTYLLDTKTENEFALINTTLKEVTEEICETCNVTISSEMTLPETSVRAFVLNKGDSCLEGLSGVLYEHGYSFSFDGSGNLILIDISGESENVLNLTEQKLLTGLNWTRSRNQYDKINVQYASLIKKENEQVYWEGNGADSEGIIPIVLQPGQYYPYESAPEEEAVAGQVYQTFSTGYAESYKTYSGEKHYRRSQKTSLLYTENHSVVQDWDSGITLNRTGYSYCSASVRLYNGSNQDKNLYQLAIRADAWYRQDGSSVTLGSGQKSFDYETRFLFDSEQAQNFAGILSRYYSRGQYKISGRIEESCMAGDYVTIDTGLSGVTAQAIVLSSTYSPETELYSVTMLTYGEVSIVTGLYQERSAFTQEPETVINEEVTYGISQSAQSQPSSWTTQIPAAQPEQYLWTKVRTEYSSGRENVSLTYSYQGKNGTNGAKGDTGVKGDDGYSIIIESSAGTVFKNSTGSTTLTAHIYQGGNEIDTSGTELQYQWKKYDAAGNLISTFSASTKSITVSASDVNNKNDYEVEVTL